MSTNICKSLFTRLPNLRKNPDNKPAIVRLCLVALTLVVGLILTIMATPYAKGGLGGCITAFFTGVIITIMAAALVWGFAKWAVFIFPKTKALANGFWNSLTALGLIGLAIKVMVWLWLYFLPIPLYGLVLTPLYLIVGALSMIGSEVLSVLLLTLLVVGTLAFMVLLDVCYLMELSWKEVLRAASGKLFAKKER